MPRFRYGNVAVTPEFMPPMQPIVLSVIPKEVIEILKSLDQETLERCSRAMRNGTAGEPTSTEKGVLRRVANQIGMDDVIALSWAGTYLEQTA